MRLNHSLWFAAMAFSAVALLPLTARAQETTDEVSATGKGITGGALLGGEVVMLTEAALGAKPWWAYLVGGVAGAAGGGVGGYFAEQNGDARVSLYLLAGGMALAIPTTVAVLSQTAYEPPADYTQDTAPTNEPAAEPPAPEGTYDQEGGGTGTDPEVGRSQPVTYPTAWVPEVPRPPSLVGLRRGAWTLSVPAVEIRDRFTRRELHELGVRQRTEVRVPIFSASF
jgi:hypothetical protein